MKKIYLFLLILALGVVCSACINTYAVNQLNKLAMKYSQEGNLEAAAARLESGVDLDGGVYETRYNLAVTYLDMNKCEEALEQINEAYNILQKDEPAIFYVQGAANACVAKNILDKQDEVNESTKSAFDKEAELYSISKKYVEHLNKSVEAFEKYMQLASVDDRNPDITNKINQYRDEIQTYSAKYNL